MWRPEQGGKPWRDWLLPARTSRYVLRLGQAQFQLWQVAGRRLILQASRSVEHIGYNQFQAIANEVIMLAQALPAGSGVQLLIDSKWMPLSLLTTGRAPLSNAQVQALALHRFGQTYGEDARGWQVQTNYVKGDAHALAFACSAQLLSSLRQALGLDMPSPSRRTRLTGMQPTFGWAWDQVQGREARSGDDWLMFAEQDRSIMARIAKGRVLALQPAGPILRTPAQLASALPSQARRCGLIEEGPYQALGVSLEPYPNRLLDTTVAEVRWHVIGTNESEAPL